MIERQCITTICITIDIKKKKVYSWTCSQTSKMVGVGLESLDCEYDGGKMMILSFKFLLQTRDANYKGKKWSN